jgi:RNA polymerase sigma-70 factor (ECF subfamily)
MDKKEKLFNDIFRQNQDRIHRLCLYYESNLSDRNDLFQEVFTQVWLNLDRFRGEAQISTWIYRIAINTCLSFRRKEKKNPTCQLNQEILADQEESGYDSSKDDQVETFISCVNQLPKDEKTILSLYMEELPVKEIAEITGLSETNIRVKIHRIKGKLSKMVTTYTEEV